MWVLYVIIVAAPFPENIVFHGKYMQEYRTEAECRSVAVPLATEMLDMMQTQAPYLPMRAGWRCQKEGEQT